MIKSIMMALAFGLATAAACWAGDGDRPGLAWLRSAPNELIVYPATIMRDRIRPGSVHDLVRPWHLFADCEGLTIQVGDKVAVVDKELLYCMFGNETSDTTREAIRTIVPIDAMPATQAATGDQ